MPSPKKGKQPAKKGAGATNIPAEQSHTGDSRVHANNIFRLPPLPQPLSTDPPTLTSTSDSEALITYVFLWSSSPNPEEPLSFEISLNADVSSFLEAILLRSSYNSKLGELRAYRVDISLAGDGALPPQYTKENLYSLIKNKTPMSNARQLKHFFVVGEYLPISNNTVQVLITEDLLSESEFLKLCPPPLGYLYGVKSTGTTPPNYARTPQSVITWDGFKDNVNNAIWDNTPKYSHPAFQQYPRVCDEASVSEALNHNVFRLFNTSVLGQDEEICRHTSLRSVVGEPDFIQKDLNGVLHLVIEVKSKWVLFSDDLVTVWVQNLIERRDGTTSPISIYNPLRQIFGYLSHNHLQFGVLTTYDKTWFLYRPLENPSQLCISPVIQYDNQQPTLFQCLFYLISLARDTAACDPAPPSSPLSLPCNDGTSPGDDGDSSYGDGDNDGTSPGDDGDSSYGDGDNEGSSHSNRRRKRNAGSRSVGRRPPKRSRGNRAPTAGGRSRVMNPPGHSANGEEKHTLVKFFDWGAFRVLDVLGQGRSGTVFKAILHGEVVALKICDLWQHPDYEKELLNEVEVYHALKDLQGDCIPMLKGAGYTAGGLFAIATDIVGTPLEDAENLSEQERLVIQTALSSIHRQGFVHNDIRNDNILVKRNGHQFYVSFIDFAFSKKGCRRDFQKEMRLLASLVGQS